MKPGNLIVFEGINGCGKGTQISMFENFIYNSSRDVFVSRIRTPNKLDENGRLAREMLKAEGNPYENGLRAVEYFVENHKTTTKHIDTLANMGHTIIEDRNYLSTFAFQHAQGISYEDIADRINNVRIPNLTFLIDVPSGIALERVDIRKDGEGRRKFGRNNEFLECVRKNYLELPDILPKLMGDESIVVVGGDKEVKSVFEDIKNKYDMFLEGKI